MSVDDASAVPVDGVVNADLCIIGSGAAGITLARQLDGCGLNVVMLEAGGLERDPATEQDVWGVDHIGTPYRNPIPSRGRSFGGSTNLWFGRIATPDPIDFEERDWVPHSGWPLTLTEMVPWFNKAAEILDVPHFEKISIDRWSRNPTIDAFVHQGGAGLGVFLWADGLFMGPAHHDLLKTSRSVRLILQATATELVAHPGSSAIASARFCGPSGNSFSVQASRYVLAAGGLENPRLLLASTGRWPAGVGNGEDNVGRYYMDHPRGEGLARVDLRGLRPKQIQSLALLGERAQSPYGHVQFRVTFPESMQRAEGLLNHSLHAHLVSDVHAWAGYQSAKRLWGRLRKHDAEPGTRLGDDLATLVKAAPSLATLSARMIKSRGAPTELIVIDQMEQEPDPESRVTVDPRKRDRFGLPRVQVDWRIGESTFRSQAVMHRFFRSILERSGIRSMKSDVLERPRDEIALWDMKHPSGTTRMASSPKKGVVDSHCRVHGVPNLYVAGSSVFPTVGHANPTLMIVALAARLANHLRAAEMNGRSNYAAPQRRAELTPVALK
ncbi:MAG: GMC oxidoreductase [Chloroflexota bacterium]